VFEAQLEEILEITPLKQWKNLSKEEKKTTPKPSLQKIEEFETESRDKLLSKKINLWVSLQEQATIYTKGMSLGLQEHARDAVETLINKVCIKKLQ